MTKWEITGVIMCVCLLGIALVLSIIAGEMIING